MCQLEIEKFQLTSNEVVCVHEQVTNVTCECLLYIGLNKRKGSRNLTKERIEKELNKVRQQMAELQKKEKDLEEQRQIAIDTEKMKFMEKNHISLEHLMLLNQVSEQEIRQLLKQKEEQELLEEMEKEEAQHSGKNISNL